MKIRRNRTKWVKLRILQQEVYKTVRHRHSRSGDGVEGGVVDGELKKTKLGRSRKRIIELTNKRCKML